MSCIRFDARAATFRSLCRVQDRDPPLKSKSSSRAKSLSPSATRRDETDNGLKGLLNARPVGRSVDRLSTSSALFVPKLKLIFCTAAAAADGVAEESN